MFLEISILRPNKEIFKDNFKIFFEINKKNPIFCLTMEILLMYTQKTQNFSIIGIEKTQIDFEFFQNLL